MTEDMKRLLGVEHPTPDRFDHAEAHAFDPVPPPPPSDPPPKENDEPIHGFGRPSEYAKAA